MKSCGGRRVVGGGVNRRAIESAQMVTASTVGGGGFTWPALWLRTVVKRSDNHLPAGEFATASAATWGTCWG